MTKQYIGDDLYWDFEQAAPKTMSVEEAARDYSTGLLDSEGRPIYKRPVKMGYF